MNSYPEEMSVAEWKKAIQSLRDYITPLLIDFSGGEPTIYPHFLELIEFCRSSHVDWIMTTNGSSLANEKFVKGLVAAPPLKIDISIDGANDDIHDLARGVPGSLARIERGLRTLVIERNRSGNHFPIRIKVTVHRLNATRLTPIVHWAERLGATAVDFNAVRLWREEEIAKLSIQDNKLEALKAEVNKLVKLKAQGAKIETSVDALEGMVSHFSGELEFGRAKCRDPLRNFLVGPSGDVKVCGCAKAIGNVRDQGAKSIWESTIARETRLASRECSLKIAVAKGATSCTAHRSILDDIRRAIVLLSPKSQRPE